MMTRKYRIGLLTRLPQRNLMSEVLFLALYLVAALVVSVSGTCIRSVTCPCGTSGKNYTFSIDGLTVQENPCDRLSQCETCREGIPSCITCPLGRSGMLCDTEERLKRTKRDGNMICETRRKRSPNYSYDTDEIPDDISCVAQETIYNAFMYRSSDNEPFEMVSDDSETTSVPVGTRFRYQCHRGYVLVGQSDSECLPTGFWSSEAPVCVKGNPIQSDIECVALEPISNGQVYRYLDRNPDLITHDSDELEFPVGTLVKYNCSIGYALKGHRELMCTEDGTWSHEVPECIIDCGKSLKRLSPKLTRGNRTEEGEWPWVVAISESGVLVCSGTLLGRRTVVTAAHCFNSDKPEYTLYFGKIYRSNINNNGVEKRVVQRDRNIIIHPEFDRETYANDIALVRLDSRLQFTERILPICLPTPDSSTQHLVPNRKGTVTGWGMDENDLLSKVLQMADLPVQSSRTCNKYFKELDMDAETWPDVFCAGYPEGGISACRGDSGSPIVFYDKKSSSYIIEGCVSHSVRGQCDCAGRYTVFTKISSFLDWIHNPVS